MRTRSLLAGVFLIAVACDTGDGTTLREPDSAAPPVSPIPIGTESIEPADGNIADEPGTDSLASIPLITNARFPLAPNTPRMLVPSPDGTFTITAPWEDGSPINLRYGCEGRNASPPLAWSGLPDDTVDLAIVLVNESDVSRGQPFIHWVITGIAPTTPGIAEEETPAGAVVGLNFFGNVGYDGPCPAPGTTNDYTLTLFALEQQLEVDEATPASDVLDAIALVAFGQTTVTGSSTR